MNVAQLTEQLKTDAVGETTSATAVRRCKAPAADTGIIISRVALYQYDRA